MENRTRAAGQIAFITLIAGWQKHLPGRASGRQRNPRRRASRRPNPTARNSLKSRRSWHRLACRFGTIGTNHADPGVRTDPKSLIRESGGEAHSKTWSRPTAGSPPSGLRRHRLPALPEPPPPAVACSSPALAAPPFTSPARGAGRTIVPVFAGPPPSSRPSWKPTGRPRIQG